MSNHNDPKDPIHTNHEAIEMHSAVDDSEDLDEAFKEARDELIGECVGQVMDFYDLEYTTPESEQFISDMALEVVCELIYRYGIHEPSDVVWAALEWVAPEVEETWGLTPLGWTSDGRWNFLARFMASEAVGVPQAIQDELLKDMADCEVGIDFQRVAISHFHANVNVPCKHGTPLLAACRRQDDELALFLIEHGADINLHPPGKWSARSFVKRYRQTMPRTWAWFVRHDLGKKAATKARQRAWASGQTVWRVM